MYFETMIHSKLWKSTPYFVATKLTSHAESVIGVLDFEGGSASKPYGLSIQCACARVPPPCLAWGVQNPPNSHPKSIQNRSKMVPLGLQEASKMVFERSWGLKSPYNRFHDRKPGSWGQPPASKSLPIRTQNPSKIDHESTLLNQLKTNSVLEGFWDFLGTHFEVFF